MVSLEKAPDISVVLPVYNERENLEPLLDELAQVLDKMGRIYEVVAVDDGSRDGSRELLRKLAAEKPFLKVVLFRRNHGQAAAFDAGFRHVSGAIVITMDADLQNDAHDIPFMISKLEEGFDLVSGWRRKRKDGLFLRKVPSKIANAMIRYVTKTPIHDLGCSLKVYRKEITDELRLYGEMHRFITVLANGAGARIIEMEVNHRPRHKGESKYGIARTFKVLLDLLTVWFMQSFQTKPIYVFGGTGALMVGLSGLISAVVLWQKLAMGAWVHRNPLFLVAILFFITGVQLLCVGLLAEVIIRTYFESRHRAAYNVIETIGFSGDE